MARRSFADLAVVGLLLLCPTAAAAQPVTEDSLISRGITLREGGDDTQALAVFTQAWELGHGPRARAQVALAEQALGRWVDAEAHLVEAMESQTNPWIRRNRAPLDAALAVVRQHLGTVELRGVPTGTALRVEGRELRFPLEVPLRVAAGAVAVELRAEGFVPWSRTLTVAAGSTETEDVTLERVAPVVVPVAAPVVVTVVREVRLGNAIPRIVGLASAGLGGALLIGSTVAWALQLSAAQRWNDDVMCLHGDRTREETCGADRSAAESARSAGVVTTVSGLLLGAVGAVLLLTAPPSRTVVTERRGALRCGAGPGLLGVSCGTAF